jgi:hypothetical protein
MSSIVKVKMSQDAFLDTLEKMSGDSLDPAVAEVQGLPDLLDGYGITKEDFWRLDGEMMKRAPRETVLYVMYLLSRDYPEDHVFVNDDAMTPSELEDHCNDFINTHVEFV